MTNGSIDIGPGSGVSMVDTTIDPDWIIEGTPKSRSGWWCGTSDRMANYYVWDCTEGRFRWYFDRDETVFVIEGEVQVSGDGVEPTWLRAGDAALFRAGTWSTWYVPHYVRKHAVIRRGLPAPLRVLANLARRAKRSGQPEPSHQL